MAVEPVSAAITAGASLAAGYMQREAQQDANERAQNNFWTNYRAQQDAAQHGIRWRVDDARDAGINPLFAIGAPATSFSPQSVGNTVEDGMAKGLAAAGQDVSRAVNSTRTVGERASAIGESLAVERATLQNDLLRSQLAASKLQLLQQAGGNPPMASYSDVPLPRPRPSDLPYADSDVPFAHEEKQKPEQRPPLMLWNNRVLTPSGTSPMKAWEDQIGDDGPLSWLAQLAVGAHMIQHNIATRFPNGSMPWDQYYDAMFKNEGKKRRPSTVGGR